MTLIYILDDDPTIRRLLVRSLASAGFNPKPFARAVDLETTVKKEFPAAIITDLYMPDGDGFHVLSTMQHLDRNHTFPRLVISSEISEDIINRCYDLGASEYFVKPVRPNEIIVKLRRIIKQFENRNKRKSATRVATVNVRKTEPPKTLGDYDLVHKLGAGQSGQVFKAVHRSTGEVAALKVLSSGVRDPEQFLRFRREIDLAAALSHPNLVRIIGAFRDQDHYFYAMQYINGRSLEELRHLESCRNPKTILRLLKDLASAISYCHKRGILHRDLKASNILIDTAGHAYITDFGLAKIEGDMQITKADDVVGTPAYMAPEIVVESTHHKSSDIFALGLMLLEVFTGKVAVEAETVYEAFSIIHNNKYPRCRDFGISSRLGQIIDKMIEFDHRKRFKDGTELFAAVIDYEQSSKYQNYDHKRPTKSKKRTENYFLKSNESEHLKHEQ